MKEDYCSEETLSMLKACGYTEDTATLSSAMKWLRENKDYPIGIYPTELSSMYAYIDGSRFVLSSPDHRFHKEYLLNKYFLTYEQAAIYGIESACLYLLDIQCHLKNLTNSTKI